MATTTKFWDAMTTYQHADGSVRLEMCRFRWDSRRSESVCMGLVFGPVRL
jgi:hypothetical protein